MVKKVTPKVRHQREAQHATIHRTEQEMRKISNMTPLSAQIKGGTNANMRNTIMLSVNNLVLNKTKHISSVRTYG